MRTLKISLLVFILSINVIPQNFWELADGPYGVPTVYDFLQYNDSTIFLGTDEGIIRSLDSGETWSRIDGQYLFAQIRCITKDHFGVLYASRYDTYYGLKMLLKSTNQGDNWQYINYHYSAEIRYIFIPYRDTIMLGTWDMGVIRTFDGGTTWNSVNNGNIYNAIHEIIQISDGSVLAGSDGGGVFKTTNWGDLWIASNSGITPNPNGYIYAESFYETSPGNIFVGTGMGIYFSSDYGDSWIYKSNGLTNYKTAQCIDQDGSGTLYAGIDMGNGVYYSTNGGDHWYQLGLGSTINTLGWDSNSNFYAGGSGLYLYNFEDSTWIQVYNQSYTPVEVDKLWVTDSGNLLAGTQWWGLKYITNSGTNWNTIYTPEGFNAIVTINDSIFIGGSTEHIYASNDTGKIWTATGDFNTSSMHYESVSRSIYVGTKRGYPDSCDIYRSNDFGQSWELIYNFPHLTEGQWVNPIIVTKTNHVILANVIYSGQYGGTYKFYRSTDFGQNWAIIIEGVYFKQLLEDDSLNLYALSGTDGKKLYVSDDEGKTWIYRNNPETKCLALDNGGRLFRFYSNHIWYSIDKGMTWIEVDNSGLGYIAIYDAVIDHNNRIYLATSSGVYYGEADSIVVSVENIEPIKTFYLSQNYPNPFNLSTKIKFEIPGKVRNDNELVTLRVYDILGREVATLVNEEKPAGEHEVEFNAINFPSGIYFYQLKAGDYRETKKMILLK